MFIIKQIGLNVRNENIISQLKNQTFLFIGLQISFFWFILCICKHITSLYQSHSRWDIFYSLYPRIQWWNLITKLDFLPNTVSYNRNSFVKLVNLNCTDKIFYFKNIYFFYLHWTEFYQLSVLFGFKLHEYPFRCEMRFKIIKNINKCLSICSYIVHINTHRQPDCWGLTLRRRDASKTLFTSFRVENKCQEQKNSTVCISLPLKYCTLELFNNLI